MYIKVKVHADEKRENLIKKSENSYEIWVKAPAKEGRANEQVRKLLAQYLKIESKKLFLIKGAQCPSKIFEIKS